MTAIWIFLAVFLVINTLLYRYFTEKGLDRDEFFSNLRGTAVIFGIIVGVLFVTIYYFEDDAVLIACDKTAGTCVYSRSTIADPVLREQERHDISNAVLAIVEKHHSRRSEYYLLAFYARDRKIFTLPVRFGKRRAEREAERITDFLTSDKRTYAWHRPPARFSTREKIEMIVSVTGITLCFIFLIVLADCAKKMRRGRKKENDGPAERDRRTRVL